MSVCKGILNIYIYIYANVYMYTCTDAYSIVHTHFSIAEMAFDAFWPLSRTAGA